MRTYGRRRQCEGRWTALGLALMLSLTLTSCGVRTGTDTTTGRLSNRGTSGTETPAGRNRNVMEDGSYYAGADGAVKRRTVGETEWEKLGPGAPGELGQDDGRRGGCRPGHRAGSRERRPQHGAGRQGRGPGRGTRSLIPNKACERRSGAAPKRARLPSLSKNLRRIKSG